MSLENNVYPKLASESECTGCLACVASCPQNALSHFIDNDGHIYVELDEKKCIECKLCENICNCSRHNFGTNELNKSHLFSGWSLNDVDRKNATSGGVFAALAREVLKRQGVVVGACMEGRGCKHIMITKVEEIKKLQGSKYMSSSMEGIYKIIEKELRHRIVLFSGVGCQCAGVLAYFENNCNKSRLITVDLVCGGIPSRIILDKYYDHHSSVDNIISYRRKDKYELQILENGEKKTLLNKNLPLHAFNCELTNRLSCYQCQYACAHRKTDITIGDLWNYNYMKEEHSKGISTIIVHSKRGMDLLNASDVLINKLQWSQCIPFCKRIVWGKSHIFLPRKKLVSYSKKLSYDKFTKLYCISMKPRDFCMEIFRLYRFTIMHVNDYMAKRYIKKIIKKYEINNREK